MSDQMANGVLAVLLGTLLAVALLVPVAAWQYRRRGRLGPGDLVVLLAAAIYGLALWTYTLLPVPVDGFTCVDRQTELFATIRAIRPADGGVATLVRDAAFLQVALNLILFVPLGYFVRRVLRRGVLAATLLGCTVSLTIETTQTTGIWGLYDCAYRLFDVDDLLINTLGATLGSILAILLVRRDAGRQRTLPTTVSVGRRWMGMLCDVLFIVLTGAVVALAYRAWCLYGQGRDVEQIDLTVQTALQWGVPGLVQTIAVLGFGRTIGEWVVSTRALPRRPAWTAPSRVAKLAVGVGPFIALSWADWGWSSSALLAFVLLSAAAVPLTAHSRGLSGVLAGTDLRPVR